MERRMPERASGAKWTRGELAKGQEKVAWAIAPTKWQGWLDSNQRVRESKSLALPLGYTPIFFDERKK